jgi:DNA-binding NarL/FixJ family response regulator
MLVDADPVFRLGLKVWLDQQSDFTVVAEADSSDEALAGVRSRFSTYQQSLDDPALRKQKQPPIPPIDLVLLDLGIGASDPSTAPGLTLCQQLKTDFPALPILVLGAQAEPVLQSAAERMGANAYGTRSMSVRRLAQLIRQTASPNPSLPQDPTRSPAPPSPTATEPGRNTQASNSTSSLRPPRIPGPLTAMRISMRLSGLRQIDQNLFDVNIARQQTASWLKQAILDGKQRELVAARWLMSALWRTPGFDSAPPSSSGKGTERGRGADTDWIRLSQSGLTSSYADRTAARYLDREALVPGAAAALADIESRLGGALRGRPGELQNAVFEGVFAKLQRPLKNVGPQPLEIDILRPDKKLELLYLVLRQLEELLEDLRASQVKPGQLPARSAQVLQDLWDTVNTEFFGKYYTVRVSNVEEEVVTLLQQEKPVVEAQILNNIPLVPELFGHWLFQESMMIESELYAATTPQAIAYSERLLENLVIQVANAVVQPLLNRLADTEPIKKSLYSTRMMSSREIERFRNDLSWRYRLDRLVNEPKAIFESRYNLFVLTARGIDTTSIYSPRRTELDRLKGIPLVVTLAMETRDAIAPRLRTAISLIGNGVVYVLTEVLGRGLGLVGRGIFQGMGSAWKDTKVRARRTQTPYVDPTATAERPYRTPYVENSYSQDINEWE